MRRVGLIGLVGVFLLFVGGSTPEGYHSGGVAECNGCHSMHNARGSFLLQGTDPSSTCLTCHSHAGDTGPTRYHIMTPDIDAPAGTPPMQRNPGGDFGWLRKSYTWVPRPGASPETSPGEAHGHSVVAVDFGMPPDTTTTAPGGTFASAQLGCSSCHDPHGRVRRRADGTFATGATLGGVGDPIIGSGSYGNSATPAVGQAVGAYRLLRGLNDTSVTGVTFAGVAIAVAPATYNQSEATNQVRVAYGASAGNTWGNWCGSCHPRMHTPATGTRVHPVDDALGSALASVYNAYVKSGDLTGLAASSYNSLVPFAESTGDFATLAGHASNTNAYLNGPASTDQVTCISCHRAHASGFDYMLRFNMGYEFMVYNGTYTGSVASAQGRTEAEMTAAYYGRPPTVFASYQRVLCNKCHAKD